MNILLINWQDRLNPLAGGAEIHLHEIFGRLVARGHRVSLLTSGWPGSARRDTVDGIDVYRVGSRYSFAIGAIPFGRRLMERERFDIVVEALNKVPVFTPAWSRARTALIVHHLFGSSAFEEANLPIASATWLLERPLSRVYRGVPVEAISNSTADDLVARGIRPQDIRVIHPGVDLDFYSPSPEDPRSEAPTFLYLGRLKRYKRIDLILRSLGAVRERGVDARLVIAGRGEQEPELRALSTRLGLQAAVSFAGFVSEQEKRALFRRCWANVFVSPKEGWGITNLEAAACGTPTVASDSPGLRESVMHGKTGLLVPHGDLDALIAAFLRVATDALLVDELGRAARRFAERFTWIAAADQTEAHLESIVDAGRELTTAATLGS